MPGPHTLMALNAQGLAFNVGPWHHTEVLEQAEPLSVVSLVYFLILRLLFESESFTTVC